MRAAVYTRVSSNEQAEGYSLRQQREAVETYCKEQGWEVVEFIEDVDSGAWVCPVSTDCLPLSHSTSSQFNFFVV